MLLLPFTLIVLAPALLVAEDALQQYGLDRIQIEDSVLSMVRGYCVAPDLKLLKALPPEERAAAVNALGIFLKEYVRSADFTTLYAKAWKKTKPKGLGMLGGLNTRSLGNQAGTDPYALDKDPNVTLKRRLQSFLDATADVDFAAALKGEGSSRRFVDKQYEAKPPEWKMCFRAGKEASDAARSFAKGWIEELSAAK
jgi:hypothetical protein